MCDNIRANYLSTNPIMHSKMKHVDIDYHFVHEHVAQKCLVIHYIFTVKQIVETFTKSLLSQCFHELRSKLLVLP